MMALPNSICQPKGALRRRKACENCRRRKEKCDGLQPCGRCRVRRVEGQCEYHASSRAPQTLENQNTPPLWHPKSSGNCRHDAASPVYAPVSLDAMEGPDTRNSPSRTTISRNLSISSYFSSMVSHTSRLIRDNEGTYIFLGPSANLSMLQTIRTIMNHALGPSHFREIHAENDLVDEDTESIELKDTMAEPSLPTLTDARYYLQWYSSTTRCVFDLFGHEEIAEEITSWIDKPAVKDPQTCINFLVLAIGAQCGPKDCDEQANAYFTYARSLSSKKCLDAVSIATIQTYCLVTMYLLNAARPHAASMYLGMAVRAAHSLGIHRADINALFAGQEGVKRERIWKVLRIQDLFLSASLGQQPSTKETRESMWPQGYSASTDLCYIFEKILSEVYSSQEISPAVLENVSRHHREWVSRFREGLLADKIPAEGDDGARKGQNQQPNIGLCHLKEAYYWTIMLVTRPYLIDLVQRRIYYETVHPIQACTDDDVLSTLAQHPDNLLAHASVNSAILTIDLLKCFLFPGEIPKRLPYVVNSILNSAFVLGIAYFADLDLLFPLGHALDLAERLLDRFQSRDPLAQWNLRIVRGLRISCNEFVRRRCDRNLKYQRALVGGLFGDVKPLDSQSQAFPVSSSSSSSPLKVSNTWLGDGGLQEMTPIQFSEQLNDLQMENSVIWSQLFQDSFPSSLWGSDMESGGF